MIVVLWILLVLALGAALFVFWGTALASLVVAPRRRVVSSGCVHSNSFTVY